MGLISQGHEVALQYIRTPKPTLKLGLCKSCLWVVGFYEEYLGSGKRFSTGEFVYLGPSGQLSLNPYKPYPSQAFGS